MQIFDATKMKYESSAKLLSHQRVLAAFLIIVTGAACQVGAESFIAIDLPWLRLRVARWDCWYGGRQAASSEVRRHRASPEQLKGESELIGQYLSLVGLEKHFGSVR
ncbi:MAG: hypothetical protein AAAB36_27735, partial [Ensifer adhaerens]